MMGQKTKFKTILALSFGLWMVLTNPLWGEEIKPDAPTPLEQLIKAAGEGNIEPVEEPQKARIDINEYFHCPSENPSTKPAPEAIPDLKTTPLHLAAKFGNLSKAKALLDKKEVDVDSLDEFQRTPLHHASLQGHTLLIEFLLSKGAQLDSGDEYENTPLMLAARNCHLDASKLLMQAGADPFYKNRFHYSAFSWALSKRQAVLIRSMVATPQAKEKLTKEILLSKEMYQRSSNIPLFGDLDLLKTFSDLLSLDFLKKEIPGLHLSAANIGKAEIVKFLLNMGWDPNYVSSPDPIWKTTYTALHQAAREGTVETIKYLLEKGADPNILDNQNKPPIAWAIAYGHEKTARFLANQGAHVYAKSPEKTNALHWLVDSHFEDGIDVSVGPRIKNPVSLAALFAKKGAHIDGKDRQGKTPLKIAIRNNKLAMLSWLLGNGADPNQKDLTKETPLHLAVYKNRISMVEELMKYGADPYIKNSTGLTSMDIASTESGDSWNHEAYVEMIEIMKRYDSALKKAY